jgi:hypothetical protein
MFRACRFLALGFGTLVSGCDRAKPDTGPLQGQWAIELTVPGIPSGAATRTTTGVLVFETTLSRYPDEKAPALIVGRRYVNFGRLADSTAGASSTGPGFATWQGGDRAETVHARINGSQVELDLAPHVNDFDPLLRGTLAGATVQGTFQITGDPIHPLTGHFRMWRVPRDMFSDSAIQRARRGVRHWEQS